MKGTLKVSGGKLIRVDFEVSEGTISSFSLTGDFFLYPEAGVDLINQSLTGCPLDTEEIIRRIENTISSNSMGVVGFEAKDIAQAIMATNETTATS